MELKRSNIVVSLAGRDQGRLFFVMEIEPNFVYLADGRMRKVEEPKKKKCKHVAFVSEGSSALSQKIRAGEKVSNSEIRRALSQFIIERDTAPLQAEGGNLLV